MPTPSPNILDLIRKDAGFQALKENIVDASRGIARTPGNIAGSIVDLIRMFAPSSSEVGSSEWINKQIGVPETKGIAGDVAEIISSLLSPEAAAGKLGALGGAAAGILGGAGRQDLILSRQMPINSIVNRLENSNLYPDAMKKYSRQTEYKDYPKILDPSFSINKDDMIGQLHFDHGAILFPRPSFLDPINNKFSKLYNRDIYSYRSSDANPTSVYGRLPAEARKDPRGHERSNTKTVIGDLGHTLQVYTSPKFDSFLQYENSKYGADTLDLYEKLDNGAKYRLRWLIQDMANRDPMFRVRASGESGFKYEKDLAEFLISEEKRSKLLSPTQQRVVELAKKTPSEYAELKYTRPFPITAETTLGIGVKAPRSSLEAQQLNELRQAYNRVGVPIVAYPNESVLQSELLTQILDIANKKSIGRK
jgi:hypothetical protein